MPIFKRKPRYVRNKLPTARLDLTSEEKREADRLMNPSRPGFIKLIRDILR